MIGAPPGRDTGPELPAGAPAGPGSGPGPAAPASILRAIELAGVTFLGGFSSALMATGTITTRTALGAAVAAGVGSLWAAAKILGYRTGP